MRQIHTTAPAAAIPDRWLGVGERRDSYASGAAAHTTNQRMEVMAVIEPCARTKRVRSRS